MSRPILVGLGEVLWDCLPSGQQFGGAPANFACTAAKLSVVDCQVAMASAVGHDPLGRAAHVELERHGVDTTSLQTVHSATGRVLVELDADGQASYEFATEQAWDHMVWSPAWEELARSCQVVCFGTLAQRHEPSRSTVQRFIQTARQACKIFDINIRQPHFNPAVLASCLPSTNVLKLNADELPVAAAWLVGDTGRTAPLTEVSELAEVAGRIRQQFGLDYVAVTHGSHGALLLSSAEFHWQPAPPVAVVDTVGAGDAYSAALAWGILRGLPLPQINQAASEVAAYVCTQPGATPPFPPTLRQALDCDPNRDLRDL